MLKKTELGFIPREWNVDQFTNLVTIVRGASPRPIENYLTSKNDGINWIKIGDVSPNAKYITSTKEKITESGKDRSRKVFSGDFILSNSMSFGRPYILKINGCIHDGWLAIQNINKFYDADYLYYFMSSKIVKHQYKKMAAGSSVQNLNKDKVGQLKVLVLDKNEQKLIANNLSDIDNLIDYLEKLIGKKKLIKQGVMQELLTGKKRLPGFESNIIIVKFRDLNIKVLKGETITLAQSVDGKYPVVAGGKTPAYFCNKYNRVGTTITISASGANAGFVGLYKGPIFASDCNTISESSNFDISYIYYLLLLHQQDIYYLQSGGAQPHIHPKDIYDLKVAYIKDKDEQKAIARILVDLDQEINYLEKILEKYKQIKQGMMEQLLTGKIRLIESNENIQSMSDKKHNQHFDDAVVFANIVASCYSPDYPLGRKKCQKMMYLFKRFNNSSVEQFGHYAAGPYDNKARYGGFETIAIKNKYLVENKSNKGSSFAPGPEIDKAKSYCSKYGYDKFIPIFNQYLKFKKVDELELYTTVDKTILELKEQNLPINLNTVKNYISNDKAWVPKLSREVFNDENIEEAIRFSQLILGV